MRTIAFIGAALLATSVTAAAQSDKCLTKPDGLLSRVAVKDALRWARAEAAATDADSALIQMMTTGTIDAEGRSTGWTVQLNSDKGKRLHVVMFHEGAMICSRHQVEGMMATPVNESAGTILDLPRLIKIARDASKPPPDLKVLKVSATLMRHASDDTARWLIQFVDAKGYPKGDVLIDSMTGAVVE